MLQEIYINQTLKLQGQHQETFPYFAQHFDCISQLNHPPCDVSMLNKQSELRNQFQTPHPQKHSEIPEHVHHHT